MNELIRQLEEISSYYDEDKTDVDSDVRQETIRLLLDLRSFFPLDHDRKRLLVDVQTFDLDYPELKTRQRLEIKNYIFYVLQKFIQQLKEL